MRVEKWPPKVVIMGVSAAGKSTVGRKVAERIGVGFLDADDLHPAANKAKMHAGQPLGDDDRTPWLERVGDELAQCGPSGVVVACSALRRRYRDQLRLRNPDVIFIHLHGPRDVLAERAAARVGHFMPTSLLSSQLATLEELGSNEAGTMVDVTPPVDAVVHSVIEWLDTYRS